MQTRSLDDRAADQRITGPIAEILRYVLDAIQGPIGAEFFSFRASDPFDW